MAQWIDVCMVSKGTLPVYPKFKKYKQNVPNQLRGKESNDGPQGHGPSH